MTLIAAGTAGLAGAKLIAYARTTGLQASIGQVVLWVQGLVAVFRACYAAIDPLNMGYTGMLGYQGNVLIGFHFTANMVTLLLLALYWKEILDQRKVKVAIFLSRMKIPFAITSFVACAGELISTALRATESATLAQVGLVSGVIYLAISFSVSVVFFVFGARVIKRIYESGKATNSFSTRGKSRLRSTTAYVIGSGVLSLFWFFGLFQTYYPEVVGSPQGYISAWTVMYLSAYLGGFAHVAAVRFPRGAAYSGTSESHNNTTATAQSGKPKEASVEAV